MADNDQYDEYEFSDLDTINNDSLENNDIDLETESPYVEEPERKNILRNALMVLVLIFIAFLGYKFIGSYFSKKEQLSGIPVGIPPLTPVAQQPTSSVVPVQSEQNNVVPMQTTSVETKANIDQVNQKLSTLEVGQQNARSEINSVNDHLNAMNNNVTQLNEKIANLSQMITVLSEKLEKQSSELVALHEKAKSKPIRRVLVKTRVSRPAYFIQAIIPGRAWLIAGNGSTITVREGTQLAGYGIITLIDPNQGRVLTSSGQVIRFSQQDS